MKKTTQLFLLLTSLIGFGQNCTTALTIPYSEDFQAQTTFPSCWATENTDNTNPVWAINSVIDTNQDGTYDHVAMISPNTVGQTSKNDWLFTPKISFTAGSNYTIDVTYNTVGLGGVVSNQRFNLYLIDTQNSTSNKTLLGSYDNITMSGTLYSNTGNDLLSQAYHSNTSFTPTTSGDYHLALHANQTNNAGHLMVFKIDVTSTLNTNSFNNDISVIKYNNKGKNLEVSNSNNNIDTIEVYNLLGQSVKKNNFNTKNASLSLAELPNGVYIAQITASNKTTTRKFIKQ